MGERYKPTVEKNENETVTAREALIQTLIAEVQHATRGRLDVIFDSIKPKIQVLFERGQVEMQITTQTGEKEWLRPVTDGDGDWRVIDSSGARHDISEFWVARYIAGGSGSDRFRFSEGAIDEALEREMLRFVLELQFTGVTAADTPEVNPAQLFWNTHSPRTEVQTGFELDDFLSQSQGFESQTARLESLTQHLSEQIGLISTFITEIEQQVPIGVASEAIIKKLEQSPVWQKLSREQKFRLKAKVFSFKESYDNVQNFFKTHENLSPEHQAVLLVDGETTIAYSFKGEVRIVNAGHFVEVHVESAEDYDFLYLREKFQSEHVNNSAGFKVESPYDFPVIVVPHELRRPEKDADGKVTYKTKAVSETSWESTRQHEIQHSRNSFLMPVEDTFELRRAKDEIIAYLRIGMSLGAIESLVCYSYTYKLTGKTLMQYQERVRSFIKDLAGVVTTEAIDLDVLAVTPMRFWKYVGRKMDQYTSKGINTVVPYTRGYLFAEKQTSTDALVAKANQDFKANKPRTVSEFLTRFKSEYERPEILTFDFLVKIFRQNFLYYMARYVKEDDSLSLYGDIKKIDLVGSVLVMAAEEQRAILSMVYMSGEIDYLTNLGYPKSIDEASTQLVQVQYAYFAKIFSELREADNEHLKECGEQLALSADSPITIDGLVLDSLRKKVLFARQKLEEYRGIR